MRSPRSWDALFLGGEPSARSPVAGSALLPADDGNAPSQPYLRRAAKRPVWVKLATTEPQILPTKI
jgi:hypothetical protein